MTAFFPTDNYVTASVTTDYPITAYLPTENHFTASVPSINPVTASIPTDNYVTASVPTDYAVTTSVQTANPISDLNGLSRNFRGLPKGRTNENKRLTEISIANARNEIADIVYQNKTELYSKSCQLDSFKIRLINYQKT